MSPSGERRGARREVGLREDGVCYSAFFSVFSVFSVFVSSAPSAFFFLVFFVFSVFVVSPAGGAASSAAWATVQLTGRSTARPRNTILISVMRSSWLGVERRQEDIARRRISEQRCRGAVPHHAHHVMERTSVAATAAISATCDVPSLGDDLGPGLSFRNLGPGTFGIDSLDAPAAGGGRRQALGLPCPRLPRRGLLGRDAHLRTGGDSGCGRRRCRGPRLDAPRHRRPRGLPGAPREGKRRAGPHADRARRSRRSRARPQDGRGRLPRQAVRGQRAAGAAGGTPPARRRARVGRRIAAARLAAEAGLVWGSTGESHRP